MKEKDIRNQDVFNQYLKLVQEDCKNFLSNRKCLDEVACPACGSFAYMHEFSKNGFDYVTCNVCRTLYARTRLTFDNLKQFYSKAASTEYWIREFFAPMVEARREKIFKPRAEYLANYIGRDLGWFIGDIGAGFGLFIDEMKKLWPIGRYVAIEPSLDQARICEQLNVQVECCFFEELKGYEERFDLLTAFELAEHLYDPSDFISCVYRLLKPGGFFLITTLNGEGFDIQILWEHAKNIYPPCHINFFNPGSLSSLLISNGFEIMEIKTPGKLDWDILEGAITQNEIQVERFWRLLSKKGTPEAKKELQEWISRNRFSSHLMILASKKN